MFQTLSVDSTSSNAYIKIKNCLVNELYPIFLENRPIIFVCIGTDRSTGDALGPLVGYKLKFLCNMKNMYVYGSLENPIHAKNINSVIDDIQIKFINPYIIAIDSSLGSISNVGKVIIKKEPLFPGLALNKDLPPLGDMCIKGIVNISGSFEFLVLQNTRLFTVMTLADTISKGIYQFYLSCKSSNKLSIFKN